MVRATKLDEDLLNLIFLHLPSYCKVSRQKSNIWTFSPMNLSFVCRSWRAVVTSNPRLWSSIFIRVSEQWDGEVTLSCARILHILTTWFRNSASSPLSITIRCILRPDIDYFAITDVLDFIDSQGERVDELSFHFDVSPINALVHRDQEPIWFRCPPNATSFKVSYTDLRGSFATVRNRAELDLSCCTTESGGSPLRELSMTPGASLIKPTRALCLDHLGVLRISTDIGKEIVDTYSLLSACPNLEILQLTVHRTTFPPRNSQQLPAISLIHLRVLIIWDGNARLLPNIFQQLHCPSLEKFTFDLFSLTTALYADRTDSATEMLRNLASFLERSNASLRVLKLTYNGAETKQLQPHRQCARAIGRVLRLCPDLRHLYLCGLPFDNQFFQELTLDSDDLALGNGICSRLVSVVVHRGVKWEQCLAVKAKLVEDMVESQWRCEPRLRTLEAISFDANFEGSEKNFRRIQKCFEEGLLLYGATKVWLYDVFDEIFQTGIP